METSLDKLKTRKLLTTNTDVRTHAQHPLFVSLCSQISLCHHFPETGEKTKLTSAS